MITDNTQSGPMVEITYEVAEYQEEDRQAEVTYTRSSDGYTYKRSVNIPRNSDGTVDEEYFEQILEGQLNGVTNKARIGAIEFKDLGEVATSIEE